MFFKDAKYANLGSFKHYNLFLFLSANKWSTLIEYSADVDLVANVDVYCLARL